MVFGADCVLVTVIVKNNGKSVRRVPGDATRDARHFRIIVLLSKDAIGITLAISSDTLNLPLTLAL
jgi:hypothetical protein